MSKPGRPKQGEWRKPLRCQIEGCESMAFHLGMCVKHYIRFKRHGDPTKTLIATPGGQCQVVGCQTKARSKGLCNKHYKQSRRPQSNAFGYNRKPLERRD